MGRHDDVRPRRPRPRLDDPTRQRALVLSGRAFSDLAMQRLREGKPIPPAIRAHAELVVLLPGPLGACVDDAVRAGARSVGGFMPRGT